MTADGKAPGAEVRGAALGGGTKRRRSGKEPLPQRPRNGGPARHRTTQRESWARTQGSWTYAASSSSQPQNVLVTGLVSPGAICCRCIPHCVCTHSIHMGAVECEGTCWEQGQLLSRTICPGGYLTQQLSPLSHCWRHPHPVSRHLHLSPSFPPVSSFLPTRSVGDRLPGSLPPPGLSKLSFQLQTGTALVLQAKRVNQRREHLFQVSPSLKINV